MSVQRSQASIERGHNATYVVRVSTRKTSASDVSVTLTARPTSQEPTFTSGCAKGDGTASCSISSVSAKKPVVLHAQIAVASSATSVKSVKLTAAASIVTTQKWKAPTVTETTAVTSASSPKPSLVGTPPPPLILPLGPILNLNGEASTLIKSGNATGLFPVITPSPVPSSVASAHPPTPTRRARPAADSRALSPERPILPAAVSGLVVLALAILLAITRLSQRRRSSS